VRRTSTIRTAERKTRNNGQKSPAPHWPVAVVEAVRDRYIQHVDDPDWHGGERAAQEIADLLRKCIALPMFFRYSGCGGILQWVNFALNRLIIH
jgi:hypothetical protein